MILTIKGPNTCYIINKIFYLLGATKSNTLIPVWQKAAFAVIMFIIIGAGYTVFYGFWVGMAGWADMKPTDSDTAERFYLTYVWGAILIVCLIFPLIVTIANTGWLVKWLSWLLSIVIAFAGWVFWFAIIEITSK